eukprot:CAMPEP_0181327294 /NCGR_PEP_ID=MMETSP1101-20121128/22019_1 /TAXON_ID=46948 /ORGANISM="Rhodomonas abbreviata, Strain Caron Lab Isolate" /LENGTH=169 /DNA_ID=CAMNT_0023435933 /DNA_START=58 /DNA_END=563 /DNA_ORIENTATION=+
MGSDARATGGDPAMSKIATLALAVACPAAFYATFLVAQEPSAHVAQHFGSLDQSRDLSQDRFHGVFAEPIELYVHCASVLSPAILFVVMVFTFWRAFQINFFVILSRAVGGVLGGTVVMFSMSILFGAPVTEALTKTLAFSFSTAVLAAVPLACLLGTDGERWRRVVAG